MKDNGGVSKLLCEEKVLDYNQISTNMFSSIYSDTAYHIKEVTGIKGGTCIDIGGNNGYLGIEMAKITDMFVYLLDKSMYALNGIGRKVENDNVSNRVKTLRGDVHDIPLNNQSVNLVVGSASINFWEDQIKAFKEIYRVLTPGGVAYIRGDFPDAKPDYYRDRKVKQKESKWEKRRKKVDDENVVEKFVKMLIEINIKIFAVTQDESGLWVVFNK
ncbi:class I SAM-dependent methyltransferase [Clostridium sp. DJ247]|uniref:class I SAM-dependent methyltransferase n=1 Tax=Clostridium sp. DJ247 TaxID=2726188 RepID=UPI0016293787|nr:class I SAM-dependent methyltransferase [Clostridium sp. DJ247]MBC2582703.1 class I SAM-dependent methyltransferase [Clostridium sp. DJ247]